MTTAINDDLFASEVIHDPYSYFAGCGREDLRSTEREAQGVDHHQLR